jgi:hypothetical protein
MIDWLKREVDKINYRETMRGVAASTSDLEKVDDWLRDGGLEIMAARRGNIEPLRRRYPGIAEYINLPKQKRGVRRTTSKRPHDNVDMAVADVSRIRKLWLLHFGRTKRRPGDHLTAEKIAAAWWDVAVDDVLRRVKKNYTK